MQLLLCVMSYHPSPHLSSLIASMRIQVISVYEIHFQVVLVKALPNAWLYFQYKRYGLMCAYPTSSAFLLKQFLETSESTLILTSNKMI